MLAEMDMRVECDPQRSGSAEPSTIWFGSRRVEVIEVLDRWYGTDHRWWKVQTAEGQYVLRLDTRSSSWELAAVVRE